MHQEIELSLRDRDRDRDRESNRMGDRARDHTRQATEAGEPERLLLGNPAEVLSLLTQLVRAAWRALLEPVWPRVRAALDADVEYRSRRLAEGGFDQLFADLDPTLTWTGDTLIRDPGGDEHVDLGGRGVLLMPTVFKWDEAIVITQPPWQPTVAYRARGLADLWQPTHGSPHAALARLIGRTRAALLADLHEPTSTTTLAGRHDLAPGTVSEHLKALRESGLIVGERHQHEIRYRRTRLGSELVRSGGFGSGRLEV